ncbi:hypothetical protein Sjap_001970 [Stephania japonica]|uniref:Uncharacterized protein n=1 Tax=Stephania japonica TaxID=461633 RepID=A0AAP0KLV7_9MAGN
MNKTHMTTMIGKDSGTYRDSGDLHQVVSDHGNCLTTLPDARNSNIVQPLHCHYTVANPSHPFCCFNKFEREEKKRKHQSIKKRCLWRKEEGGVAAPRGAAGLGEAPPEMTAAPLRSSGAAICKGRWLYPPHKHEEEGGGNSHPTSSIIATTTAAGEPRWRSPQCRRALGTTLGPRSEAQWYSTRKIWNLIPQDLGLSRGRRNTVWGDTDGVGLGTTLPVTSGASGVRPNRASASGPMVAWALGWADSDLSRGRRNTVWGDTDAVGLGTTISVTSGAFGVRPHGASASGCVPVEPAVQW